jgi:hypothetical protein
MQVPAASIFVIMLSITNGDLNKRHTFCRYASACLGVLLLACYDRSQMQYSTV